LSTVFGGLGIRRNSFQPRSAEVRVSAAPPSNFLRIENKAPRHAEGIDTGHLFGFMIGSDVGSVGEREFQGQTTGRFSKSAAWVRRQF
jgi:hypothetical protein